MTCYGLVNAAHGNPAIGDLKKDHCVNLHSVDVVAKIADFCAEVTVRVYIFFFLLLNRVSYRRDVFILLS